MTAFPRIVTAALAIGSVIAPAAAQYPYPYPQPYPQQTYPYPGQTYPYGQNYPYQGQPYGSVGSILDQLLNPYGVNDRQAIRACANAAVGRAQNQYRYGYNQGYGGYPPYGQGIAAPAMRVTAITSVERRTFGLRVRGLISTGYGGYGGQYGYQDRGYAAGDLSFRCNVDYRGYVSDVRVDRNNEYRRY